MPKRLTCGKTKGPGGIRLPSNATGGVPMRIQISHYVKKVRKVSKDVSKNSNYLMFLHVVSVVV